MSIYKYNLEFAINYSAYHPIQRDYVPNTTKYYLGS